MTDIETLLKEVRARIMEAGRNGDKELVEEYSRSLRTLLFMRSAQHVEKEEREKGLI